MKESKNIDSVFTLDIGLVTQIRSHGETLENIGENIEKPTLEI